MEKKELLPEQKIHELLSTLKKEDKETYVIAKRVLGFLYRDVKKDFLNLRKKYEDIKGGEDYVVSIDSAKDNLYASYIDNENGILDLFINMCHNPNKRYLKRFYEGIDTFLTMAEDGIYSNYPIFQYAFNMYTMLKAYDVFAKKDQDGSFAYFNFDAVISDFESFFIKSKMKIDRSYSSYSGPPSQIFTSKKMLIDSLLELGKYKDFPEIRERLMFEVNTIHYHYEQTVFKKYETCLERLNKFYEMVEKYQYSGRNINPEMLKLIETDLFQNIKDSLVFSNFYNRYEPKESINYFLPILVFDERYNFIKETLPEIEPNEIMQQDILTYIAQMDIAFFDTFNKEVLHEKDAFVTLLKLAFDSDSYYELDSKLTDIIRASKLYKTNKEESLKLIDGLTSNKHKEVIDGIVITYPENSINKVNKPKSIFERMINLHKALPYYPGVKEYESQMRSSYYSKTTIKKVVDYIHNKFATNKNKELEKLEQERQAREEALKQQQAQEESKKVKGLGSIFGSFGKNNQDK